MPESFFAALERIAQEYEGAGQIAGEIGLGPPGKTCADCDNCYSFVGERAYRCKLYGRRKTHKKDGACRLFKAF